MLFLNNLVSEELEDLFNSKPLEDEFVNSCLSLLRTLQISLEGLSLPCFSNIIAIKQFYFERASVIFCTASSSYKLHVVSMDPLNIVVIDEAAQLKEAESTIPLQLPGMKHAILIGDERQLPAMVNRNGGSILSNKTKANQHNLNLYFRYYSMYEHVEKLAEKIKNGAASVEGVPETLNDDVVGKMSAPPKSDAPIIPPTELAKAGGFVFGFPTRFALDPKVVGKKQLHKLIAITQLIHHGMIFVPIGYTFGASMFEMEKVKGGSPMQGTYAGNGSRQPSELELKQAFHQGKHIATITKKLKGSS
ncbi:NAD(P)H dehydrogenase (quinone) FQR1 [Tanacetum coccineum]